MEGNCQALQCVQQKDIVSNTLNAVTFYQKLECDLISTKATYQDGRKSISCNVKTRPSECGGSDCNVLMCKNRLRMQSKKTCAKRAVIGASGTPEQAKEDFGHEFPLLDEENCTPSGHICENKIKIINTK